METLHAERAILASVLQKPDLLIDLDLDGRTDRGSFRSPINRAIVNSAIELYNEGFKAFDRELIWNRAILADLEDADVQQLQMYINSLFSSDVSDINFNKYLEELTEAHLKEKARGVLQDNLYKLSDKKFKTSALDFVGNIQTQLYEISSGSSRYDDPIDITKNIGDSIYKRLDEGDNNYGIPTGIGLLDDIMLGYLPTKFYFISARPGEGKSAFLLQSAVHAAFFAKRNRTRVLYLDTEITEEEFQTRLIGHVAGVDTMDIMKGEWTKSTRAAENVNYAIQLVQDTGGFYHKYVPGFTQGYLINTIKKYVYNHGVGLVILDYLKTPSSSEDLERWQKIGNLARALKEHAGVLNIPIVTALQQNKKGVDQSRVTSEANAESDDPFKEADGQFALNWKTAKEIENESLSAGTHRFQILKGRYFKLNWTGINLRFIDYCLRFVPAQLQPTEEHTDVEYVTEENSEKQLLPGATEIDHTGPLRSENHERVGYLY